MTLRQCVPWVAVVLLGSVVAEAETTLPPLKEDPSQLYSLPYEPGTEHLVVAGYGDWPTHEGLFAIDWGMPESTPILAVRAGTVVEAVGSFDEGGLTPDMHEKGNRVILQHDDGSYSMYWHLEPNGARVKVGQRVAEGQEIGRSGNTGYTGSPHLHFMLYRKQGSRIESFPVFFKSGEEQPFTIARGGKYRAPGGTPKADEGPLKGIVGTGELSSIRKGIDKLLKDTKDPRQAALAVREHLRQHKADYHATYKRTFAKAQTGDKSAMKELQDFMADMSLESHPGVASLLNNPVSANIAQDALNMWWGLYSMD